MANESVHGDAPEGVTDNATPAETSDFGGYASQDELIKGATHKQQHIETLEAELNEMRKSQNTSMNMESFLEKLRSDEPAPVAPTSAAPVASHDEGVPAGLSASDVDKLVSQKVNQLAAKTTMQSNYQKSMVELEKAYGPGYGNNVRVATTNLGETDDFMNNLAANNPQAFIKLVSAAQPVVASNVNPAAPQTIANTSFAPVGTTRNEEFYSEMRKKDSTRYLSYEVQRQMDRDAQQLGEAFFRKK